MNTRWNIKLLPLLIALAVIALACRAAEPPPASSPTVVPTATPTPTPTPVPPTRRAIIIQGVCSSSSSAESLDTHWVNTVKDILKKDHGLIDLPAGHPDDQVIEYSYSVIGWDSQYEPRDTLQAVALSSFGLREIYFAYPNSEFFILGHSLGGIVALDGLARYSNTDNGMIESTAAIVTVSSPVRGLRDLTASAAGAAIELVACRQVSVDGASDVWDDVAKSGQSISLIHDHDWSSIRAVNFGNEKDLVVDIETATFPELFDVSCYNEGSERFLELNHDTLLGERALASELLQVLMNGEEPKQGC